jgi:hypothetical protein
LRGLLDEQDRSSDPFSIVCGLYELPSAELFQRAEAELGITDTLCLPWVLDGNLSDDERNGRTLDVEVYRPSVERFATEILGVCQPG